MANSLAGTAYFSIDGTSYMLVGDLNWSTSKVNRETQAGMDGVHGFSEKPIAGFIEGTFRDNQGLTVAAFNSMTDNTVMAELANGKVVIARNAWTAEHQEVNSVEATFKVRWESREVVEA